MKPISHTLTLTHTVHIHLSPPFSIFLSLARFLTLSLTLWPALRRNNSEQSLKFWAWYVSVFLFHFLYHFCPQTICVSLGLPASVWGMYVWYVVWKFTNYLLLSVWQVVGQDELEELIADMTDEQVLQSIIYRGYTLNTRKETKTLSTSLGTYINRCNETHEYSMYIFHT